MTQNLEKSLQNRILFQYLSSLSAGEIKAFSNFCTQSALSQSATELLIYITNAYPNFAGLAKDQLFIQSFLQDAKAKKRLNYGLHDLLVLLQKWLMIDELERDAALKDQLLIRACKRRFLHTQFFKKTEEALTALEDDFLPIPSTWLRKFTLNYDLFFHVQTSKNQPIIASLTKMEDNLDLFYYGAKIRLLCQKIFRQKKLANLPEIDATEQEHILHFAQTSGKHIPFFSLYTQLIQYLEQPDFNALKIFFQQFKKHHTTLGRLDQTLLLTLAAYSLNDATVAGNTTALSLQFALFHFAFTQELVMFDNEMNETFFNNFLLTACMLQEFKLAHQMLKKYSPYFKATIRVECTNLMKCTIFYYQKKYEKLDLNLQNSKFKQPGFRIRSRNLLIKSLYERYPKDAGYKGLILTELVNLRKYIQKQQQIPPARKEQYYQMIIVIRKLTNAFYARPAKRAKVKEALTNLLYNASSPIMSHNWLVEKVNHL